MALPNPKHEWPVAEAKNKLSEVLDRAQAGEPQHITRRGRRFVLAVEEDWELRHPSNRSFLDYLRECPNWARVKSLISHPEVVTAGIRLGSTTPTTNDVLAGHKCRL